MINLIRVNLCNSRCLYSFILFNDIFTPLMSDELKPYGGVTLLVINGGTSFKTVSP